MSCFISKGIVAFTLAIVLAVPASAFGTWYVKGDGDDGEDGLTFETAFRTISRAYFFAASGDTIKVYAGDYDVDAGETFPLPVVDGVSVVGQESSPSSYPRVGGDLRQHSISAPAVIVIDATTADRSGMTFSKLHFLGEDIVNVDSAGALQVVAGGEHVVDGITFSDNYFDRPCQNSTQDQGVATLHFEATNGTIQEFVLDNNKIEVSNRGGIEMVALAETGEAVIINVTCDGNSIRNTGGGSALFGVRWHGLNGGTDEGSYTGFSVFQSNLIRSYDSGIIVGVEVVCEEHSSFGHIADFNGNWIDGCAGDGLYLSADGWVGASNKPVINVTGAALNRFTNCGGSGVVMEFDKDQDAEGEGYMLLVSSGNLYADNAAYGFEVRGFGVNTQSTGILFSNDTNAYNGDGGEGYAGDDENAPLYVAHSNCIMWGNNSGGTQVVGLGETAEAALLGAVNYSDWQGIEESQGNISEDPKFVSVSTKNYHLDDNPLSPCVDAGSNALVPDGLDIDLDRDDRVQDGDCSAGATVDMGFDELFADC